MSTELTKVPGAPIPVGIDVPLTPLQRWRKGPNALGKSGKPQWLEDAWESAEGNALSTNAADFLWRHVFTTVERELLGNDLKAAYQALGPITMWQRIYGGTPRQAVVDIGIAAGFLSQQKGQSLLRHYGEMPSGYPSANARTTEKTVNAQDQDDCDLAIAKYLLVIHEGRRTIHWNGEPVEIEWYRFTALWAFLTDLARLARRGEALEPDLVEGLNSRSVKKLANLKWRLGQFEAFPAGLHQLIQSKRQRSYRLLIAPERIRIFEKRDADRSVEVME